MKSILIISKILLSIILLILAVYITHKLYIIIWMFAAIFVFSCVIGIITALIYYLSYFFILKSPDSDILLFLKDKTQDFFNAFFNKPYYIVLVYSIGFLVAIVFSMKLYHKPQPSTFFNSQVYDCWYNRYDDDNE